MFDEATTGGGGGGESNGSIGGNISVSIRFRPINSRELESGDQSACWNIIENSVQLSPHSMHRNCSNSSFSFDGIFGPNVWKNLDIYNVVGKDLTEGALCGVNATIFAYGQTSAGKTFTMLGTNDNPGIITCGLCHLFSSAQKNPDREFSFRVSYLEIYNETVRDLLYPGNSNLKIHESLTRGIFVGNLAEEPVACLEEALSFIKKGEEYKHVGETNLNEKSSRSHSIFRISIESREKSFEDEGRSSLIGGPVLASTLTFVDLAGSEKARSTGAEGQRLKEGGHINKSLLALTFVISKLSEGDRSHIPYRDSKLTRILQNSLGGNSRTAIICAATLASEFVEETLSTLKFASRAKTVVNKPRINEIVSDQELLRRAQSKVAELERELEEISSKKGERENPGVKRPRIQQNTRDASCSAQMVVVHPSLEIFFHLLCRVRKEMIQMIESITISEQSQKFMLSTFKSKIGVEFRSFQQDFKFKLAEYVSSLWRRSHRDEAVNNQTLVNDSIIKEQESLLMEKIDTLRETVKLDPSQKADLILQRFTKGIETADDLFHIASPCDNCLELHDQLKVLEQYAKICNDKLLMVSASIERAKEKDGRIITLEKSVMAREGEVSMLLEKIRSTQDDLELKRDELQTLTIQHNEECKELRLKLNDQENLEVSLKKRILDLETEMTESKKVLESHVIEGEILRKTVDETKSSLDFMASHSDLLVNDNQLVKEKLLLVEEDNRLLSSRLENLHVIFDAQTAESLLLKQEIESCKQTIKEQSQDLIERDGEAKVLRSALKELEDHVRFLEEERGEALVLPDHYKGLLGKENSVEPMEAVVKGLGIGPKKDDEKFYNSAKVRKDSPLKMIDACSLTEILDFQSFEKQNLVLRVELEKLRDQSVKERRRLELVILDLEEQLQHSKNHL